MRERDNQGVIVGQFSRLVDLPPRLTRAFVFISSPSPKPQLLYVAPVCVCVFLQLRRVRELMESTTKSSCIVSALRNKVTIFINNKDT